MARCTALLSAFGSALSDTLLSGRKLTGAQAFEWSALQRPLGARWLSFMPGTAQQLEAQAAPETDVARQADEQAGPSSGEGGYNIGFRRVSVGRRGAARTDLEGVVHIQNTFNNIILTLTDKHGSIKTYTSAGVVGFKGSRKSQPAAAERAAEELARRALKLGFSTVDVRLKGPGNTKQFAVQSLAASGLQITSLADVTPIPYNGCRPPKRRRV